MTTAYEEAVREATDYLAEADLHLARTGRLPSIPLPANLLRTLLAGPPGPSEGESPHLRIAEIAVATMQERVPALDAYGEDEIASFEASVAMSIRAEERALFAEARHEIRFFRKRADELLVTNNQYLERARTAEAELQRLRGEVEADCSEKGAGPDDHASAGRRPLPPAPQPSGGVSMSVGKQEMGSDQPHPSVSNDTQNMEALSAWMIANSYATGHGDTMEDLLSELDWQHAKKIAALSSAIRILSDTGRSDTARILDARDRLIIGRGEIMRHSTDDAMNDALAKDAAILEAFGQDAGPTIEDLFDDCGWVPYAENGDPPVTAGTTVTIRFRDGSEMTDIVRAGAQWSSGEAGYEDAADVVAYRIVTDNG